MNKKNYFNETFFIDVIVCQRAKVKDYKNKIKH